VGSLVGVGLTMGDLFRLRAAAAAENQPAVQSVILLWMSGGPSHVDTWDPKPEASDAIHGPFKAIKTNVDGLRLNENLTRMAKLADKYTVIHSVTHPSPAHEIAHHIMLTGNVPARGTVNPAIGSIVAKEKGFKAGLPPYVCVPSAPPWYGGAGFLGGQYKPFAIGSDPNRKDFRVQGLSLPKSLTMDRIAGRRSLLSQMDGLDQQMQQEDAFQVMDTFYARAYDMLTSPKVKSAFNLGAEDVQLRERYGRTNFGQSCLLGRRLVERGVPFVTVHKGGWDTHFQNFPNLKRLIPDLDQGFSALLSDLSDRGLLEKTLVICAGEFGRTPKIDYSARWQGGRHHVASCFSVVMAGGGIKVGQVIGASDDTASKPKTRPVYPWEIAATL